MLRLRNETEQLRTMYLEPWGEDYWMRPSEEMDIVARTNDDQLYFQVDYGQEMKVWVEGQIEDICVFSGGARVEGGYQRPQ